MFLVTLNMVKSFEVDVFFKCQSIEDCKHEATITLKDGRVKKVKLDGASIYLIQSSLNLPMHNSNYTYIVTNAQKKFFFPNIKFLASEILANIFT